MPGPCSRPRPVFRSPTRSSWSGRTGTWIGSGAELGPRDAICVLTHDTKFDVPAILGALRTRVGYLGAMGSRRTHEQRWQRLVEAGADEAELKERLMSPIGLDIGARTPEETAVAICAEIIAVRTGRSEGFVTTLRSETGPIHRR